MRTLDELCVKIGIHDEDKKDCFKKIMSAVLSINTPFPARISYDFKRNLTKAFTELYDKPELVAYLNNLLHAELATLGFARTLNFDNHVFALPNSPETLKQMEQYAFSTMSPRFRTQGAFRNFVFDTIEGTRNPAFTSDPSVRLINYVQILTKDVHSSAVVLVEPEDVERLREVLAIFRQKTGSAFNDVRLDIIGAGVQSLCMLVQKQLDAKYTPVVAAATAEDSRSYKLAMAKL